MSTNGSMRGSRGASRCASRQELAENEGVLDKRFAKLVNRKACASIAWAIGIKDFILMGNSKKNIKKNDEKILSDACESLIGAIYIDQGYDYVRDFILRVWKKTSFRWNSVHCMI